MKNYYRIKGLIANMKNEIMNKISQVLFYMNQIYIAKGRENADNMSIAFRCMEDLVTLLNECEVSQKHVPVEEKTK